MTLQHGSSRSYSVVVITVDFDSTDTGSNPVRTFFDLCLHSGAELKSHLESILRRKLYLSKFARVVKGVDLRSTGRRPRGFEPHSLHPLFGLLLVYLSKNYVILWENACNTKSAAPIA